MARSAVVHVIGTGTIGEPLTGLLTQMKEPLGIEEVSFHKRTPLLTDRSKVVNLIKRGAIRTVVVAGRLKVPLAEVERVAREGTEPAPSPRVVPSRLRQKPTNVADAIRALRIT